MIATNLKSMLFLAAGLLLAGTAVRAEDAPVKPMELGKTFDVAANAAQKLGQLNPAAAFDGKDTFLVVWEEGWDAEEGNTDIKAARVKADGTCLDPAGITICQAKDFQERPAVAYSAGEWLVVWHDIRSGKDYDVYGARVSAKGKCLDPDGVLLCGGAENQCQPAVASNGKVFCLAWSDFRGGGGYRIRLGRVSPEGKPLDGDGVVVQRPVATDLQLISPQIVWGKGNWLVSFLAGDAHQGMSQAFGGLRCGAWSPTLELQGKPVELYIHMAINHPTLAADGDVALAAFGGTRSYSGASLPLMGVRLDGSSGRQVETGINGEFTHDWDIKDRALAMKLPNYLAIYKSLFALSGRKEMTADSAAAGSDGLFLVVSSMVSVPKERSRAITAVRVQASDGKALDGVGEKAKPVALTANDNNHLRPAVAAGKDGQFLVLWEADRGLDEHRIEARFVQAK